MPAYIYEDRRKVKTYFNVTFFLSKEKYKSVGGDNITVRQQFFIIHAH